MKKLLMLTLGLFLTGAILTGCTAPEEADTPPPANATKGDENTATPEQGGAQMGGQEAQTPKISNN
jgi:hypothetical protein